MAWLMKEWNKKKIKEGKKLWHPTIVVGNCYQRQYHTDDDKGFSVYLDRLTFSRPSRLIFVDYLYTSNYYNTKNGLYRELTCGNMILLDVISWYQLHVTIVESVMIFWRLCVCVCVCLCVHVFLLECHSHRWIFFLCHVPLYSWPMLHATKPHVYHSVCSQDWAIYGCDNYEV